MNWNGTNARESAPTFYENYGKAKSFTNARYQCYHVTNHLWTTGMSLMWIGYLTDDVAVVTGVRYLYWDHMKMFILQYILKYILKILGNRLRCSNPHFRRFAPTPVSIEFPLPPTWCQMRIYSGVLFVLSGIGDCSFCGTVEHSLHLRGLPSFLWRRISCVKHPNGSVVDLLLPACFHVVFWAVLD